jgi:hypothetical protein
MSGVTNQVEGTEIPFYSPHRESVRWSVRDLDMSNKEPGHIQKMLLESGLGTGQVR